MEYVILFFKYLYLKQEKALTLYVKKKKRKEKDFVIVPLV